MAGWASELWDHRLTYHPSIFQSVDILSWLWFNFVNVSFQAFYSSTGLLSGAPLNLLSPAKCGKCSINTCPTCTDQSGIVGFLLFCIKSCLTCPTLQCFLQNHNFCVKSNRYNNCSINTSKSVIVLYKGECINGKIMCSYWVLGPQNQYIQHNMPPYKQSVPKKESTKYKISSQAKRHRPSPLFISLTILIYH